MSFFKELGEKITKTTQGAVQGTKDFAEITKINTQISEMKRKINLSFSDLGKSFYEKNKDLQEGDYSVIISTINDCEQKIKEFNNKIRVIKGVKNCGGCNEELSIDVKFCSSCGHNTTTDPEPELPAEEPKPQAQKENEGECGCGCEDGNQNSQNMDIQCPECNSDIPEGIKFCTNCGHKVA